MGHPKFARPKYDTPPHPWKADRIEEEHAIKANHGLKNMTEIWKAKSALRRIRGQAMKLIGRVDTSEGHYAREKDALLASLNRKGLIQPTQFWTTFYLYPLKTFSIVVCRLKSTTRD